MMRPKFLVVLATLLAVVLAGCSAGGAPSKSQDAAPSSAAPAPAPAPAKAPEPVKEQMTARLGIGSTNALIYLPVTVATANGYFDQQKLKIERPNFSGGAQIAQALVDGNLDFASFSYNHVIKYQTQGIDLVAVAMMAELPGSALVVDIRYKDKITKLEDLKGLKVGVTSPGSGSHDVLLSMLNAAGMSSKDVSVEGVGFDLAKAFKEGKVPAGVTYEPYVSILVESGQGVLLSDARTDLRTPAGVKALYGHDKYPMTALVTSRSLAAKNPELVQRMVNAIVAANRFIANGTPGEIASKVPDSDKGDPAYYERALKAAKNIVSPTGAMDVKTVETVAKDLKVNKSIADSANVDLTAVFDNKFIQQSSVSK